MAAAPPKPLSRPGRDAVIVFTIGSTVDGASKEMLERCERHGADPTVLDASEDPLFVDHLSDPRMLAHFPLLCVRGGLVGGLEVVRQLDARGQLREVLVSTDGEEPRIALGKSAAEELGRALVEPLQCIRIVVTEAFDHELSVDTERPDDLKLVIGEVPVLLDPQSASRADGIAIDWSETPDGGHAFRIDNPNRPEPVHLVDRSWLEHEGRSLDLLIIDARTSAEYARAHLDQARLLDATLMDALEQLNRNTSLLFYCNGGIRSKKAAERYRELGFAKVYCLTEGVER